MIKEAMEKIVTMTEAAASKVTHVHGLVAFQSNNGVRYIEPPKADTIEISTLSGINEYLKTQDSGLDDKGDMFITVCNEKQATLSTSRDDYQERTVLVGAKSIRPKFPFDRFLPAQEFIIKVQTCFAESENKRNIIDFASKVRSEKVQFSEDNGIAQTVTVSDKVGRLELKDTNPIVDLVPFRTFAEVDQPESQFLFRIEKRQDDICCALFEADAEAWKVDAINNIVSYLKELPEIEKNKVKVVG